MELILMTAAMALGLGALMTRFLATRIPEAVLERAHDHGRYAYLGEDDVPADEWPSMRTNPYPSPRLSGTPRSRAGYNANPLRETLRRRAGRAASRGIAHIAARPACEPHGTR